MKHYYITTPIYYVNGSPHIGHAYTSIASDVIARFMRLSGYSVKFLTGTDEHGQKVARAAHKTNVTPKQFVDNISSQFENLNQVFHITNDDFIRTTEVRHIKAVQHLWKELASKGHIYLSEYAGWYDVREETYYGEDEVINGKLSNGNPVEWVKEPSYFFSLSKWQDKLLKFYEDNPNFIKPESRRNEVISFVKSGLRDLSISRVNCKWGIPVPGDENHTIYVWLDALTNYISALGYPDGNEYKNFWPADVHIIGKEIIRFHAIYWPAFLMAADIPIPKSIMSHGWWISEGEKMSKSLGNVIDPFDLCKKFGVDPIRYFMMREMTFGNDGNFTQDNFINCVNSELANKIGNLIHRTLSLIYTKCNAKIPNVSQQFIKNIYAEEKIIIRAHSLLSSFNSAIHKQNLYFILDELVKLVDITNQYITEKAPWHLKNIDDINQVLYIVVEVIRYVAILLQPFIPSSAAKILDQLNIPNTNRNFEHLKIEYAINSGIELNKLDPVFIKFEKEIL